MVDLSALNIFGGDNKTLLWVGLGLMVVAIAVYVYMTRKPTASQQAPPASQQLYPQFQHSSQVMEQPCQVHPAESFQHPSEQQPTQITCMVNESGEQVCDDNTMLLDTSQPISA